MPDEPKNGYAALCKQVDRMERAIFGGDGTQGIVDEVRTMRIYMKGALWGGSLFCTTALGVLVKIAFFTN